MAAPEATPVTLRSAILKRVAMEEKDLPALAFNQPVVVRTPLLWLLVFEERSLNATAFRGKDGEPGAMTRAFLHGAAAVYSGLAEDDDEAPTLTMEQSARAQKLATVFAAMGTMYAAIPLVGRTEADKKRGAWMRCLPFSVHRFPLPEACSRT